MNHSTHDNPQLKTEKGPLLSHVLITGMGACSAGGVDLSALWKNVLQGNVHATIEIFPHLECPLPLYRAPSLSFQGAMRASLRHADRSAHLAVAAADEAWKNAGLEIGMIRPERLGVIIGTARGPVRLQEQCFSSLNETPRRSQPTASLYTSFSSIAALVAKAFKAEGPSFIVSSSCTSGATALHTAAGMIQSGLLDIVIVTGVEAPLTEMLLEQYYRTGILSTQQPAQHALAPFDQGRSGTVLGEGAACVILESEKSATRRKATLLGRLESISLGSQSRYRAGLDPKGTSLQKILHQSLQEASLHPSQIPLIHLHGTGTRLHDHLESHAVASFFGEVKDQPYAWATKAITGHTLGAAALFQLVLTLCALRDGIVPPITNCTHPDPLFPLRLSKAPITIKSPSQALCLTAGFWGNVASMIVSR
ncbi:MAG: beta-ketoacyl-[acyl-carrier-protein] synthase family protein [Verrucomicrobiae bacterium]|jgi:3-oxoacyl-[acyl-carrier-protein] synthase II|nr:beta-ketoacyl-[acyl-carrier-protein] synthase family protein [Verrucomicrobiae bacterium]